MTRAASPPTAHVLAGHRVERDDEPKPRFPVEEALANATDADVVAGLFRVHVIGG